MAEPPARDDQTASVRARRPEPNGADAREAAPAGERKQQGPPHSVLREYFESLVVTAIMALFGMTFVVQAVKVPTGSMQNTILIGDHLLVNKFIFAPGPAAPFLPMREIERGDIIVFKYPGKYPTPQFEQHAEVDDTLPNNTPYKTNYVKRVVGLPGDRVEIRGTEIFINGQPLEERRVAAENPPHDDDPDTSGNESSAPLGVVDRPAPAGEGPYSVYWAPEKLAAAPRLAPKGEKFDVPEGHYFVLGDNRDNSQDSRYWGYVPREAVIGRAMFVYWSYDESKPRDEGAFGFLSNFLNNTRWGRTGTLVR